MTQVHAAAPIGREAWEVASTGRRSAAWLVDLVLLFVLVSVVAVVLGGWHATTRTMINDDGSTWTASTYYLDPVWSYSLLALFSAIYAIPMWRIRGATVGQRLLGLRVVDVSGPELLSWFRAAVRWLALFGWAFVGVASDLANVLTVVAALWLVGLLASQMRDDGRQGVHDRLARSLVVRRRRGMPSAWT
ncbi:MAG TPA: RDD family protein [Candidatus Limnocylindrales bacterium]|jgi:uncharacterized RDD family membrane protein YckC